MRFILNILCFIYRAEHVRVGREVHIGHFVFGRLLHINPRVLRQL